MNLKLYAVGSSHGIGHEIEDSVNFIFGSQLPVVRLQTAAIAQYTDGDLYVCNPSQYEPLLRYVPDDKIVLLNIEPTPQFYLQIASLPAWSTVYMINSQLPYIQKLIRSFDGMGIKNLRFVPVPHMELPEDEVCRMLGEARYIAGVDRLLYEDILKNPRFRDCLRPDVMLIGAKRIASLSSIFHLVNRVNELIRQQAGQELTEISLGISKHSGEGLYLAYQEIDRKITELRELLLQADEKDDRLEKISILQLSQPPLFPPGGRPPA